MLKRRHMLIVVVGFCFAGGICRSAFAAYAGCEVTVQLAVLNHPDPNIYSYEPDLTNTYLYHAEYGGTGLYGASATLPKSDINGGVITFYNCSVACSTQPIQNGTCTAYAGSWGKSVGLVLSNLSGSGDGSSPAQDFTVHFSVTWDWTIGVDLVCWGPGSHEEGHAGFQFQILDTAGVVAFGPRGDYLHDILINDPVKTELFDLTLDPNSTREVYIDVDPTASVMTFLPEPGSICMLAFGAVGLILRRR